MWNCHLAFFQPFLSWEPLIFIITEILSIAVVFADRVIIFTFSLQPTKDDDKGIENNVVVVS